MQMQVRADHGSECVRQMQGQMHVHVPDLSDPVPVLAHFFHPLLSVAGEALAISVIE
ncbi:hypothetical protein [Streptomyces spiramyceticus]|uniref:hypothetical protein n=1 Tax=Streptomyces spiramyceticus TaxID=299717 RepID=UPI00237B89E7|nr:hypothetical protein [Streptomyces spiramyceticus]